MYLPTQILNFIFIWDIFFRFRHLTNFHYRKELDTLFGVNGLTDDRVPQPEVKRFKTAYSHLGQRHPEHLPNTSFHQVTLS